MSVSSAWCRCSLPLLITKRSTIQSRNLSTYAVRTKWTPVALNPACSRIGIQNLASKRFTHQIVEEGVGTHKPSAFQKKVLVWGKVYPSVDKVPERVTRNQLKRAMDKFRVRVSIMMIAGTFVASAIMALIGRRERQAGNSVSKMNLERRKSL